MARIKLIFSVLLSFLFSSCFFLYKADSYPNFEYTNKMGTTNYLLYFNNGKDSIAIAPKHHLTYFKDTVLNYKVEIETGRNDNIVIQDVKVRYINKDGVSYYGQYEKVDTNYNSLSYYYLFQMDNEEYKNFAEHILQIDSITYKVGGLLFNSPPYTFNMHYTKNMK